MAHIADKRRWLLVGLVFVAIVLNYVDRQILALLKPTLQAAFAWSDRDYSHMASAFQFAAAIAFLGTGWFIDKVGLRVGFAIGVGVWSLAGMAHAFVTTVAGFVTSRAVLGAAESIGTPAALKTAATYFDTRERSIVLGLGGIAPNIGAILTPLLIPLMALMWGWQATFLIAGGLGLVWVVVWFAVRIPEQPGAADTTEARIPWSSLLSDRRQWAVIAGKALMQIHGDWMKGQWRGNNKVAGTDFGCINIPGTKAVSVTVDSFGLLGGVDEATAKAEEEFAAVAVDPKINAEFAFYKGSSPVRLDVPTDKLDACNTLVLDDLKKPDFSVQNPFYIADGDWINSVWNTMFTLQGDQNMTTDDAIKMLKSEYDAIFN